MTADEFVHAIEDLQTCNCLRDDQVASACLGIVITYCRKHAEDPLDFMRWGLEAGSPQELN